MAVWFTSDAAIDKACARLRSAAWAGSIALIFASWGVAYGTVSLLLGTADASLLLLSVAGVAMSMPVLLDVLVRLGHCRADDDRWPQWLLRLSSAQAFRPLPGHLIDGGDKPACEQVDAWLEALDEDYREVKQWAERLRESPAGLSRAGAVNLWLLAKLRRRQLQFGLLKV